MEHWASAPYVHRNVPSSRRVFITPARPSHLINLLSMDPADSTRVVFGEGCPSDSQPVSPEAVVKYLVQNEPLTHVAGILRCVDGYTSELKQESLTMVSPTLLMSTPSSACISTGGAGNGNRYGEGNYELHWRTSALVGSSYPPLAHIDFAFASVLRECQGIYSTVGKRTKEAEDVIDTRSQDLRGVIAQLRSTVNTP